MERDTKFTHLGRPPTALASSVNPAISRASTLLFEKAEDLYRTDIRSYGRHGTQVHDALAELFTELEGGFGTTLFSSGLAACTFPILPFVKPGDHILLTDSAYGPIGHFCRTFLKQMGIETEIYEPRIGAGIEALIKDNTRVIFLESPGSLTFEVQDVPAITKIARKRGVKTILDNTWSAGLCYQPLSLSVDISCHAATKYFGGHSDVLYGAVICKNEDDHKRLRATAKQFGNASSPDDAYQVLRGFRSVLPRFRQQEATAKNLAEWLMGRDEVVQVLHPAISDHPDHALWKRDFSGSGCVFSVVLKPISDKNILDLVNAFKLFGIGFSYGGFESLVLHCGPQLKRQYPPQFDGPLIRFACGLEAVGDLKADIEQAFASVYSR